MTLFKQWQDLIENQTDETFEEFWNEYSAAEIKIYEDILNTNTGKLEGTVADLLKKYEVSPVIFLGFLDGIQSSLNSCMDLDTVTEETEIALDIDFEKLFFNMLQADAGHLYTIEAWDNVLTEDQMKEIIKAFKATKTVVKEKKVGRNDPCPCGSGKKYKHCCGK